MIAIKIKDDFIDLKPDTQLSIVLRSSFIETQEIALSYAIPFTIPATDYNNRLFGFLNQIPIATLEFESDATLLVENMPYKQGYLKIKEWSDEEYSVEFQIELGQFITELTQPISTFQLWYYSLQGEEALKTLIQNSVNHTWEDALVFPEFFAPEALNGFELLSENNAWKWINYWDSDNQRYNFQNRISFDIEYVHAPMFFMKYVLDYLRFKLGFEFGGAFWESDVLNELVIFSSRLIEILKEYNGAAFGYEVYLQMVIAIDQHLPKDATTSSLLRQLANMFCLYLKYDHIERKVSIEFKKDLLAATEYTDYTDKLIKGYKGKRSGLENTGIKYSDDIFPAYVPPHAEKYIEIEASTLLCDFATDDSHTKRILPIYNGQANADPSWKIGTENIDKLHLLFWRGLENGEDGKLYPRAFIQGKLDSASSALSVVGSPISLYNLYFQDYLNFLNNAKKVKFSLIFTIADLLNFDIYKKIRVLDVVYIVNTVEITLTMQGMYLADLECYTVVSTYSEPCSKDLNVVIDKDECSKEMTAIIEADS